MRWNLTVKLDAYSIVNFHPESGTETEPVPDPAPKTYRESEVGSGIGSVPVPDSG